METIVRKYGGSSLASLDRIKFVAEQIKSVFSEGNRVVAVVSAMGKTTDELLYKARELSPNPSKRELDMLLSTGERQTISLLAIALQELGVPSLSLTGSQVGIITDSIHGDASILEVKPVRLQKALDEGNVVIVAGFQGVSTEREVTTLGRGGTDTTAVAIAASINADRCELMKDVDGLYNVPPEFLKFAHIRKEVSYTEMMDIVASGVELVSHSAIELAKFCSIKIGIGNTFTNEIGTLITNRELHSKGIHQVVYDTCVTSRGSVAEFGVYSRHIRTATGYLNIDSDPDSVKERNSVLFSCIGHQINQLNTIRTLQGKYSTEYEIVTGNLYQAVFEKHLFENVRYEILEHLKADLLRDDVYSAELKLSI